MWFACRGGVATYDGLRFTTYGAADGMPLEECRGVSVDDHGRVWVAPERGGEGIAVHDGEWSLIPAAAPAGDRSALACSVTVERDGRTVFVMGFGNRGTRLYTDGVGWSILRTSTGAPVNAVGACSVGEALFLLTDEGIHAWPGDLEHTVLLPGSAGLEISGFTAEVVRGEAVTAPTQAQPFGSGLRLWVAGPTMIGRFEDGVLEEFKVSGQPEQQGGLLELAADGIGGIAMAAGHSLWLWDEQRGLQVLDQHAGVPGGAVGEVLYDRDGNLWATATRGISRLPATSFLNYHQKSGLLEDEVSALLETSDGWIAIGHPTGVTLRYGPDTHRHLQFPRLPVPRRVEDMCESPDGGLWMACTSGGVAYLRPGSERWSMGLSDLEWFGVGAEQRGVSDVVRGVLAEEDGTVWAVSSRGLYRFEDGRFRVASARAFAGRGLALSPEGELALTTKSKGIVVGRPGSWRVVMHPTDSVANSTYSVYWPEEGEAGYGEMLIGTRRGLYVDRGGDFVRSALPELAITRPIFFIQPDAHGRIWFGTDKGLVCWNGRETQSYTVHEGLSGQEMNRAASLIDSQDRLIVGTDRGLSVFLGEPQLRPEPPLLTLVGLESNEIKHSLQHPVELHSTHNDWSFAIRAVSFVGNGRPEIRTRLVGLDEEWSEPQPATDRLRYSNLLPGSYSLEVQARHAKGDWGAVERSSPIQIRQPIVARPWFRGLVGLIAASLIVMAWSFARTRRERSRLHLELDRLLGSYRDLFDKTPAAHLLLQSGSFRIMEANEYACELLGLPRAKVVGGDLAELAGAQAQELHAGLEQAVIMGDSHFFLRARLASQGADERHLELTSCTIELPGAPSIQVTMHDATERLEFEQERVRNQKHEALGRLASGIAHDFNNLLTVVVGHTEIARRKVAGGSEPLEELSGIAAAGERGAQLVRHLLAFSRRQELELDLVSVGDVVSSVRDMLERIVLVDVSWDICATDGLFVQADRAQLERVLMNLVMNARDACQERDQIHVMVSTVPAEGSELGEVLLQVKDTGSGMPPSVVEHVFEPFFTTKPGGTGLGLPTSYGIITQFGGRMSLQSEVGVGTTFDVRLPRVAAPPEPEGKAAEQVETKIVELRPAGRRVLVVEDEPVVRQVVQRILKKQGHDVLEASGADAALDLGSEVLDTVDLVLTDVVMPEKDGVALALELRRERPELPVIFMSGHSRTAKVVSSAFCDAPWIAKPFRASELAELVEEVLVESGALDGTELTED